MFNNSLINVFIGLAFLFLIYSLFVTALQEAIATILKRRSRMLYSGIRTMLTNTPRVPVNKRVSLILQFLASIWWWIQYFFHAFIQFFSKSDQRAQKILLLKSYIDSGSKEVKLYDKIYKNPIIKNFRQNIFFNKPSYISPQNFAALLVEEIKNLKAKNRYKTATFQMVEDTLMEFKDRIDVEAVDILKFHLNEAAGDLNVFKSRLEKWFNDSMDRVSGWYKRNTQFILLLLGLVLSVVMNIDTIEIVSYLSKDKQAAEKLAEMGVAAASSTRYSVSDSLIANEVLDSLKADLHRTNTLLGLGWGDYGASDSLFMERCLERRSGLLAAHGKLKDTAEKIFRTDTMATGLQSNMTAPQKQQKMSWFILKHDSLVKQYQFRLLYSDARFTPNLQLAYIWHRIKSPEKLLGFFISIIAIGLGAPFWFDLLNRLVNIRSAGKVISTSGSTTSKKPEANTEIDG